LIIIKVAFIDRDGTINKDYSDEKWKDIRTPELLDGSIDGMKLLLSKGYKIIIITNQYIISDGIISLDDYQLFTNNLLHILEINNIDILKIYYCPHNDEDGCKCRKPKPGMIEKALEEFDIDMSSSIYCGDSECDYLLAKHFHLPFYGIFFDNKYSDAICCENLHDAAILAK
jgi:D-glycero-D-manno-heptose 1,7-bisphosphate phosphatase